MIELVNPLMMILQIREICRLALMKGPLSAAEFYRSQLTLAFTPLSLIQ
jgi:hypothetical protein